MAYRPLRVCAYAGCGIACKKGYCDTHKPIVEARRKEYQRTRKASYDKRRPNSTKRLYDADWRRARAAFLIQNPFCEECKKDKQLTPATVVDHRIPHKGNRALFWDKSNWQSLCKPHHDHKTATEDSRFAARK